MTIWTKLIAAGLLLAVLSGLALLYGNAREQTGASREREKAAQTAVDFRKQMHDLEVKSRLKVDAAIENLHLERRKSDAKLAELKANDESVRAWLETRIPVPLVDIIWMSDTGPVGVLPGGYVATGGFDATGKTYRASHEQ